MQNKFCINYKSDSKSGDAKILHRFKQLLQIFTSIFVIDVNMYRLQNVTLKFTSITITDVNICYMYYN